MDATIERAIFLMVNERSLKNHNGWGVWPACSVEDSEHLSSRSSPMDRSTMAGQYLKLTPTFTGDDTNSLLGVWHSGNVANPGYA